MTWCCLGHEMIDTHTDRCLVCHQQQILTTDIAQGLAEVRPFLDVCPMGFHFEVIVIDVRIHEYRVHLFLTTLQLPVLFCHLSANLEIPTTVPRCVRNHRTV